MIEQCLLRAAVAPPLHGVYVEGEFAFDFAVTPTTGSAGTVNISGGVSGKSLRISGVAADAGLVQHTTAVQRLYVAYFNRPADPVSLSVYEAMLPTDSVATQAQLQPLAETYFSPSAEYTANFAGKSNTQTVDQLYQNIFGRSAEVDGLIYWADKLTDGSITVAGLALTLSYAAQGTDAAVVSARIEAAIAFTSNVNTTEEIIGYSGNAAAAKGREYLAQISGTLPTNEEAITAQKNAAIANVDASIAAAIGVSGGGGSEEAAGYVCLTSSALYYSAASSVVEMKNGTQLNNYSGRTWSPSNTLLIFRTSSARWYALDIHGAYDIPAYEIFRVDVLVPPQTCFEPDLYEITRIKEETGLPTIGGGDEYFYSRDGSDAGSFKARECSIEVGATVYFFEAYSTRKPVMLDVDSGRYCEGSSI